MRLQDTEAAEAGMCLSLAPGSLRGVSQSARPASFAPVLTLASVAALSEHLRPTQVSSSASVTPCDIWLIPLHADGILGARLAADTAFLKRCTNAQVTQRPERESTVLGTRSVNWPHDSREQTRTIRHLLFPADAAVLCRGWHLIQRDCALYRDIPSAAAGLPLSQPQRRTHISCVKSCA